MGQRGRGYSSCTASFTFGAYHYRVQCTGLGAQLQGPTIWLHPLVTTLSYAGCFSFGQFARDSFTTP